MADGTFLASIVYEPNDWSTICGLTEKRVQNVTILPMKGALLIVSLLYLNF